MGFADNTKNREYHKPYPLEPNRALVFEKQKI